MIANIVEQHVVKDNGSSCSGAQELKLFKGKCKGKGKG